MRLSVYHACYLEFVVSLCICYFIAFESKEFFKEILVLCVCMFIFVTEIFTMLNAKSTRKNLIIRIKKRTYF